MSVDWPPPNFQKTARVFPRIPWTLQLTHYTDSQHPEKRPENTAIFL